MNPDVPESEKMQKQGFNPSLEFAFGLQAAMDHAPGTAASGYRWKVGMARDALRTKGVDMEKVRKLLEDADKDMNEDPPEEGKLRSLRTMFDNPMSIVESHGSSTDKLYEVLDDPATHDAAESMIREVYTDAFARIDAPFRALEPEHAEVMRLLADNAGPDVLGPAVEKLFGSATELGKAISTARREWDKEIKEKFKVSGGTSAME